MEQNLYSIVRLDIHCTGETDVSYYHQAIKSAICLAPTKAHVVHATLEYSSKSWDFV